MNSVEKQYETEPDKTRILIVDGNPVIRHGLTRFISQKYDLVVCAEADNACQALESLEKKQVDLAIVDISPKGVMAPQIVEEIKLKCPNLPILILSMHDQALCEKRILQAKDKEYLINKKATEQIIDALRYAQSLLKSRISGFFCFVKIEKPLENEH